MMGIVALAVAALLGTALDPIGVNLGEGSDGISTVRTVFENKTIVPGDTLTEDVVIRNDGTLDGDLEVRADLGSGCAPTPRFCDLIELNGTRLGELRGERATIAGRPLAAGESTTITLTLEYPHDSTEVVRGGRAQFDLIVTLTGQTDSGAEGQHDSGADAGTTGENPSFGALPSTGSDLPWWLTAVGIVALIGGLLLVFLRRRRRSETGAERPHS